MLCWNERGENKCLLLSISAVLTPLALLYEGLLSPGLRRQAVPRSDWSHAAHRYGRNPCEGKKIKGGISKFWSISHIEAQLADDDNGRLGRGGYKEVSIGLQLEVGVSGYRPKLFSGDSLDERDRW